MNIETIFKQGLTYREYRELIDKLLAEGKTTGNTQTEKLVEFTRMNVQRMNRIDKTIHLPEDVIHRLRSLSRPVLWLLVGDAWCGDSAQIIPVINKMAEARCG